MRQGARRQSKTSLFSSDRGALYILDRMGLWCLMHPASTDYKSVVRANRRYV